MSHDAVTSGGEDMEFHTGGPGSLVGCGTSEATVIQDRKKKCSPLYKYDDVGMRSFAISLGLGLGLD
jgi:hypothetical protein